VASVVWDDEKPAEGGVDIKWDEAPTPKSDDRTMVGRWYEDYVAKPLSKAIAAGMAAVTPMGDDPNVTAAAGDIAEVAVPQTLTELGVTLGTGAAGKAAATGIKGATTAAKLGRAALRTGGAATGAGAGAAAEGKDPLAAAGTAGAITAGAEAVVPGASAAKRAAGKVYRSTEMGRRAIVADDARRVGEAIEGAAPTLKPGRTATEFQRTAEGPGLARIGDAKEVAVLDIEGQLAKVPAQTPDFVDAKGIPWVRVPGGGWQRARAQGEIPMPSLGEPSMSLRDANAKLSEIGDMMRGIKPLDPRFPKDVDLRAKYGEVAEDIAKGIERVAGPVAAVQWRQAQAQYRAGRFLADDVLGRTGLVKQGEFNITDLQRWLKNPENRADLARATGGDLAKGSNLSAYNRIVDAIERGAEPGMVDRMAGQAPGLLSGRGSYGAWRVPAEVLRRLFPNASSQYVGRVPYGAGLRGLEPGGQAALDLAVQRALAGAGGD